MSATVAIPVLNGGAALRATLAAVRRQSVEAELLICDSGSTDGSSELAREEFGARVVRLASFTHGGARNLLMRESRGERVALLTQDAEPATNRWLEQLLEAVAGDVAIAYGPYIPRPDADPATRHELEAWFGSLPAGVERLAEGERDSVSPSALLGRRGFFTDANACVSRAAWAHVPFREQIPYAEDRALALDMLRAGYGKAYVPQAAVLHSHNYSDVEYFRRCFDEWRGLREVYGWVESASPRHLLRQLRGELGVVHRSGTSTLPAAARHHLVRLAGALLGSRADRLPPAVRRRCSLERRSSFEPST
ncbi:MAG: glycosyltransferase family 2 protein [Solirubrobacteraceae bacterium]